MFMRGIAVLVAAVVLMTASPAMAQSSDLLASAARVLMTQEAEQDQSEAEQDQSIIRRRRSGGLALVGGILTGVGVVIALQPPKCVLIDGETPSIERPDVGIESDGRQYDSQGRLQRSWTVSYRAELLRGTCTAAADVGYEWGPSYVERVSSRTVRWTTYGIDNPHGNYIGTEVADVGVLTDKTWNYVGWATAAAGGVLLGLGLRNVDVPIRLDVAPGGFRVVHSLGW